jgi:hypothetical protein
VQIIILPKTATVMQCPGTVNAADLSAKLSVLRKEAPWHVPIFTALLADEIAVCMPMPGQSLPVKQLDQIRKPVIVMVADDGPLWLGPDGWACAHRAFRWANATMIHGSGGEAEHYSGALLGARLNRRFVLVDTSSAHLPAWRDLAKRHMGCRPILAIEPRGGHVHPVDAHV